MPRSPFRPDRQRLLRRAATLATAIGLATTGVAAPLLAQPRLGAPAERDVTAGRFPRKIAYSIAGSLIGFGMYVAYDRMSLGGERGSRCTPEGCALPYLTLAGAVAGFFAGYERDQSYELQYRYGAPVKFETSSLKLRGEPLALALGDSLVAVAGTDGVHVVEAGPRLRSVALRASGFSGVAAVAFANGGARLGVATTQSVALLPTLEGRGVLARDAGANVLITLPGGLLVGDRSRVEWIPGSADADSVGPWNGVDAGSPVRSGRVGPDGRAWLATDSGVVVVRTREDGGAPAIEWRTRTAYPVRAVAVSPDGQHLAVAFGNRGVGIYRLGPDGRPLPDPIQWGGAQYAYDVQWLAGDLFVAAGTEGLYRLTLSDGDVAGSELARGDVGYPTALERRGAELFLLDRSARALVRVTP